MEPKSLMSTYRELKRQIDALDTALGDASNPSQVTYDGRTFTKLKASLLSSMSHLVYWDTDFDRMLSGIDCIEKMCTELFANFKRHTPEGEESFLLAEKSGQVEKLRTIISKIQYAYSAEESTKIIDKVSLAADALEHIKLPENPEAKANPLPAYKNKVKQCFFNINQLPKMIEAYRILLPLLMDNDQQNIDYRTPLEQVCQIPSEVTNPEDYARVYCDLIKNFTKMCDVSEWIEALAKEEGKGIDPRLLALLIKDERTFLKLNWLNHFYKYEGTQGLSCLIEARLQASDLMDRYRDKTDEEKAEVDILLYDALIPNLDQQLRVGLEEKLNHNPSEYVDVLDDLIAFFEH